MNKHRKLTSATAFIGGSLIVVGGFALAPALAYPPGNSLTVACDATTYSPGATAVCTLNNAEPGGQYNIVLGDLIAAAPSDGFSIVRVSISVQDSTTFTKNLTLPSQVGTYEVVGTSTGPSGTETATTQVKVVTADSGSGGGDDGGKAEGGGATTPKTGANATLGVIAGLGALGLGGGLYVASRRKKV